MTQGEFTFDAKKKMTIMERFSMFHEKNPHVYTTLVEMARKASKNGTKQCSIAMLFEVLRWRTNIETERIDEFKISNCLRAPYARHIMAENPELAGIFNLKTSETDDQF